MSNDNVLDDLRAYVSALADDVNDNIEMPTPERTHRGAGRRRLAVAAAVAVIAVLVGATLQLVGADDDDRLATGDDAPTSSSADRGDRTERPDGSTNADAGASDLVSVLPDPPLDVRGDMVIVWSGEELIVWGGDVEASNMGLPGEDQVFADGAAFDPATNEWRVMSPAPLPANAETPVGVSTDAGVVIARGVAVALWDPLTDTWSDLPDAPGAVADLTWTGQELVSASANATFALDADAWTRLDPPPVSLERQTTAWTGSELIVVGGPSTPFTSAAAIALDPEIGRWRTLPEPPPDLHAEALAATWDGDRVVVVNYDMQAVSYDPSLDAWASLAPVPARFSEWYPAAAAAQGYSVAFMARTVAVLRPDGGWVPLPYGNLAFGPLSIAADPPGGGGPVVYSVGFTAEQGRNIVTALDLGEVTNRPPAVQVGITAVSLPADFVIADTDFVTDSTTDTVAIELTHDDGSCRITSTYRGQAGTGDEPLVVSESLPETPGVTWRRNGPGTTWAAGNDTDTLTIACDSPSDAELLARSSSF